LLLLFKKEKRQLINISAQRRSARHPLALGRDTAAPLIGRHPPAQRHAANPLAGRSTHRPSDPLLAYFHVGAPAIGPTRAPSRPDGDARPIAMRARIAPIPLLRYSRCDTRVHVSLPTHPTSQSRRETCAYLLVRTNDIATRARVLLSYAPLTTRHADTPCVLCLYLVERYASMYPSATRTLSVLDAAHVHRWLTGSSAPMKLTA